MSADGAVVNQQTPSVGRWKNGASGAALTVLLGLLFLPHPLGQGLANLCFDLPFRWRPNRPVKNVMIVYMDEGSSESLGQPWNYAEWDRWVHARLLNRLKDCGAKAVVFDIHFKRPSTNDEPFLTAIVSAQQSGTIVIVGGIAETSGTGHYQMTNTVGPFPALEKACPWALAELGKTDSPLRQHFLGTERMRSLAWRTAELTQPQALRDAPAQRWINYYGPPGFLPHRSYADALDPRL